MKFKVQKRLASSILRKSAKKVAFDTSRLDEVKEAITRFDIKSLIKDKAIKLKPVKGPSRVRSRKLKSQKSKGRRRGLGSRKGKATARLSKKEEWMSRVRKQRAFLRELKKKGVIDVSTYRMLYNKSKGGYFRSKRHIKLYMEENDLVNK
ncbi:MAG: 50S ribosomal protein L19e [Nanobdellota archaeon]